MLYSPFAFRFRKLDQVWNGFYCVPRSPGVRDGLGFKALRRTWRPCPRSIERSCAAQTPRAWRSPIAASLSSGPIRSSPRTVNRFACRRPVSGRIFSSKTCIPGEAADRDPGTA